MHGKSGGLVKRYWIQMGGKVRHVLTNDVAHTIPNKKQSSYGRLLRVSGKVS